MEELRGNSILLAKIFRRNGVATRYAIERVMYTATHPFRLYPSHPTYER